MSEELTTDDTDRHGRKEGSEGADEFAGLAGGCGQQAAKSNLEAKETVRHLEGWVRKSDENPGKWTNEPERGCNGLKVVS